MIRRITTGIVTLLVGLGCSTRARSRPTQSAAPQIALDVKLSYIGDSTIGFACLPRTGDSTRFEVDVVVDSLQGKNDSSLSLQHRRRSPPRPGYIHQSVTVEIQRASRTRLFGTSCWHDAGIVVRGTEVALAGAIVSVDGPGVVVVHTLDSRGRSIADSVRSAEQGQLARIRWTAR